MKLVSKETNVPQDHSCIPVSLRWTSCEEGDNYRGEMRFSKDGYKCGRMGLNDEGWVGVGWGVLTIVPNVAPYISRTRVSTLRFTGATTPKNKKDKKKKIILYSSHTSPQTHTQNRVNKNPKTNI